MSVGPPPYINHEPEWGVDVRAAENSTLTFYKNKLDEMRIRDKDKTDKLIDGLYNDIIVKVDPDYSHRPSEADSSHVLQVAMGIVAKWF